jgi:CRP-like cAMP-binding protein
MQLISSMDLFRGFQVSQALELLFMAKEARYEVGSEIVEQGTPGDKFMIVVKGSASVTFGGAKKVFRSGDYLGEISVITGAVRTATVVAETAVLAMEVDKYAFDYLVMHDPRLKVRMENLIKSRSDGSWRAIANNSLLSTFSASQKTQLQALLTVRTLNKGDKVWNRGEKVHMGVLISKGGLRIEELSEASTEAISEEDCQLTVGMLVFDMLGVMNEAELTTTLVVQSNIAVIFTFDAEAMMSYLDSNPLLLLGLLKSLVII